MPYDTVHDVMRARRERADMRRNFVRLNKALRSRDASTTHDHVLQRAIVYLAEYSKALRSLRHTEPTVAARVPTAVVAQVLRPSVPDGSRIGP